MTTRKTLKDYLSSNGVSQDRISYNINSEGGPIQEGHDLGNEPLLEKPLLDLDNEEAGLLGDYLSYIVDLSSNEYKINSGNERAATTNRGDSLVVADEQGASSVFVPQGTVGAASLNEYSDSKNRYGDDYNLSDIVDKTGREEGARLDLHKIEGRPNNVTGETQTDQSGEDNIIIQSTQNILKNYNRFSNTKENTAYAPKGISPQEFEDKDNKTGSTTNQTLLGNFEKNKSNITIASLKEIGASLLMKSSGFDNADTPGQSENINNLENKMADSNSVLSNTYDDSGYIKRNIKTLRSFNAKGFPENVRTGRSEKEGSGVIIPDDPDAKNNSSFGSTYNSGMPFMSPNTKLAKIQAAASIVALLKITNDFFETIQSLSGLKFQSPGGISGSREFRYNGPGPFKFGRYNPSTSAKVDFVRKVLLTDTIYPYSDCVEAGIIALFGKSSSNVDKVSLTDTISQSDGFWQAVANSILKSSSDSGSIFARITALQVDFSADNIAATLRELKSNKILGFMNTCAVIGDMFLRRSGGSKNIDQFNNAVGRFDVDSLPDGPATRVGKSRASNGRSQLELGWNSNSVPSMFLLPKNVVRAVSHLGNITVSTNPMKGMLGSDLINNTYLDTNHDGSYNRIDQDVVKRLEDRLDAEYVPFYIQDLRTNEIIAFHAFLETLTDSIAPTFTSVSGYGRMDPVQIYKGTTRSISTSFTLFATSREDFDMMWYKINKLTTLLYPQWTKGTQVKSGGNTFTQPFSQIMGASPIVRLRIGDVIKSNYSKFNLARIFGIGDSDTEILDPEGVVTDKSEAVQGIFVKGLQSKKFIGTSLKEAAIKLLYIAYGTPLAKLIKKKGEATKKGKEIIIKTGENLASNFLQNGFVNPLGLSLMNGFLTDPDQTFIKSPPGSNLASIGGFSLKPQGYGKLSIHFLKPTSKGYLCLDDGKTYNLSRSVRIMVMSNKSSRVESTIPVKNPYVKDPAFKEMQRSDFNYSRTAYEVSIIDFAAPSFLFNKKFLVYHSDILANPADIFNRFVGPAFIIDINAVGGIIQNVAREAAIAAGVGVDAVDYGADKLLATPEKLFMDEEHNPIVRAFNSTKGRGLAGTLGQIQFDWLNYPWEVDWNSRAPMGVKISLSLSVIHDIPPGLDHSGYNRAPLYNVGNVMRHVAGDPHDDDGLGSEFNYKNSARSMFRSDKIKGE